MTNGGPESHNDSTAVFLCYSTCLRLKWVLTPNQASLILIVNDYSAKWDNVRLNIYYFIFNLGAIIIIYIIWIKIYNNPIK